MIISHVNFIVVLSVVAACRNYPHTLLLFDGTNSNHKHIEKNLQWRGMVHGLQFFFFFGCLLARLYEVQGELL